MSIMPPDPDDNTDSPDCGHHSWAGLMALLDEHWPERIFPTRADDPDRDDGPRIISLLRWVDRLRGTEVATSAAIPLAPGPHVLALCGSTTGHPPLHVHLDGEPPPCEEPGDRPVCGE